MPPRHPRAFQAPSLTFVALTLFLITLWVAGGASRADAPGQVLVRAAACVVLAFVVLLGPRPRLGDARVPVGVLLASIVVVAAQLLPLPFDLWKSLPGRTFLASALSADTDWRPLTLSPSATLNALFSLLVPAAVLYAVLTLSAAERALLLPVLTLLVVAAAVFGLFQLSVGYFDNPLINDTPWQVNGSFANRNHYALFLALGCVLVPAWGVTAARHAIWLALALGVVMLLLLIILASGSRAGLLVALVGTVGSLFISRMKLRRRLHGAPRWALPASLLVVLIIGGLLMLASSHTGRAVSIERLFAGSDQGDMRSRALPTVLAMLAAYFPVGAGAGTFDTAFRIHEPFELLKPTFFNHAHNDFLEISLDTGLAGALMCMIALGWWVWAGLRVWHSGQGEGGILPKAGWLSLLLVIIASGFDYPARTPMIMAMLVIAAVWLADGANPRRDPQDSSALPMRGQHL